MSNVEAQWISEAKAGDKDAFAKLVEKYQKPVYSVCYRMLGTPTAAEDAAQEAFIRAYQALDRYDPERSFATWILSIASNYSIDQLRKKKVTILSMDNEKYRENSGGDVRPRVYCHIPLLPFIAVWWSFTVAEKTGNTRYS